MPTEISESIIYRQISSITVNTGAGQDGETYKSRVHYAVFVGAS